MKLVVQEAAERDILQQVAWYAEKDLPDIARRFSAAVVAGSEALMVRPQREGPGPRQTRCSPVCGPGR